MGFDAALSLGYGIEYLRHPVADIIPYDILHKQAGKQDADHRIEQVQVVRSIQIEIAGQKMLYEVDDRLQDNSRRRRADTDQETHDQYEMLLFYMLVPPQQEAIEKLKIILHNHTTSNFFIFNS